MGRLPSLTAAFAVTAASIGLVACEQKAADESAGVTKSRAAAVEGTAPPLSPEPTPAPIVSASSAAKPATAPAPRNLCASQMGKPGRDLPKAEISRAGTPPQPATIPVGGGKWTWLNFWAAWCVPCKEEIPRLKAWEENFASSKTPMRVVFVSLDDDQRQLETFLTSQPAGGLRSTFWLKDGEEREKWLEEAEMEADPRLPAHLLIDPKGKIRCTIDGAMEDSDLPSVEKLLAR